MIELYETVQDSFVSKSGVINLDKGITLSNKQRSFLNLAVRMSETSELPQQHGAVIVKAGSVISLGVNKWRNRSLNNHKDGYNPHLTYHAEVDAISHAGTDLTGAVIYIARIGKDGSEKFSRPCQRCTQAIKEAGIKKVVYTTGSDNTYVL